MRFLFLGPGIPGVQGADAGSGIGTYLREMTAGLTARGHACHVLVWGGPAAPTPQVVDGVTVHLVAPGYWRVVERWFPGARNVHQRRMAVRHLDARHHFDWIEIQSDEGIDLGAQRDFRDKTLLRVHTTLAQMVEHKRAPATRRSRVDLDRERRSIAEAKHLIASTADHAAELRRLYPSLPEPTILPLGLEVPAVDDPPAGASLATRPPRILVVGSPDLRKGFDRLRPVLDAFARLHGPCRCVIVSGCPESTRDRFRLVPPLPEGVEVRWRSGLGDAELADEYRRATCLLHLARYESFGYPLVEAAAHGTPVVATPVGVAPDLLSGTLCRFLVDGDDPEAIARALAAAAHQRAEVGTTLRGRYRSLYSREVMVENYLRALRGFSLGVYPAPHGLSTVIGT